MEEQLGNFGQPNKTRSRFDHIGSFAVLLVLCVAIVFHSLTGIAFVAATMVAVHAGWKSFHSGLWLLLTDPLHSRRWPCFWFYTSTACFKATIWGLIAILLLGFNESFAGKPPTEEQLVARVMALIMAMTLTIILGIVAVVSAMHYKVRVWVHPSVWDKCQGDFRRLGSLDEHIRGNPAMFYLGVNHATFIVIAVLLVPAISIPTAFLICLAAFNAAPHGNLAISEIVALIVACVGPFITLLFYAPLCHRIVAQTPAECWHPATLCLPENLIP